MLERRGKGGHQEAAQPAECRMCGNCDLIADNVRFFNGTKGDRRVLTREHIADDQAYRLLTGV
jgi:hypothetical protein